MHAAVAVQYRKEHGQPVLVQANRHPSRVATLGHVHQGLDLHQQGPGAFPDHHHHASRGRVLAAVQEYRAGVFHFLQPLFQHGEYAQLIHRAKPVLDAAQCAVTAVAGAFQQDGAVDHVLQNFRAGQAAVLGDVPDKEQDGAGPLGKAGQESGTFAYLGHAAGG